MPTSTKCGCTAYFAARSTLPRTQVVIVEEAAEVFEAHVLACLSSSVEHLVLIGG